MATSIIKLHSFSGARDNGPPCFLLQVDDFYCLLDCGWREDIPQSYIKELSKWIKMIDAVLISHPSMRHLGLLPILVGKYGLKCPIYATTPVFKLGHLVLYDAYESRYISEDFSLFGLDDVDAAFDLFVQVKYQQTINLQGKGHGLSITPLPSGHMLGGTIWKLVKDETDIIYAVDFNHKKGRHLNGATFDACIRPRLLIMDVSNSLYTHPRRKNREEALRQVLLKTLRRGGNVLIAVDTAGYCLEIAHLLETLWHSQDSGFMAYGLAMLSHVAYNVFDFTKQLVEWMSDRIMRSFEDQRSNPFHLRHLQLCHTLDELDFVPDPKVIIASEADLQSGFSRLLFAEWADSDLNTVIVTSRDGDFRQLDDISEFASSYPQGFGPSLSCRLIGLTNGEPWARIGVSAIQNNTIVLPFTLSQRVVSEAPTEVLNADSRSVNRSITQPANRQNSLACDEVRPEITPPTSTSASRYSFIGDAAVNRNNPYGLLKGAKHFDDDEDDDEEDVGLTSDLRTRLNSFPGANGTELPPPLPVLPSNPPYQPYEVALLSNTGGRVTTLTHGRHQAGYDIFPGAYNHSGGQFFRMAKRTQLVFPTSEKTIQWDEYGERIDPAVLKLSAEPISSAIIEKRDKIPSRDISRLLAEAALEMTRGENFLTESPQLELVHATPDQLLDLLVLQNSAASMPEPEIPKNFTTKCVVQKLELPIRCEISFIDYESRSDGEALKKIITGLRPQEMILVGATKLAVDHMIEHCKSVHVLKDELIHSPSGIDVVNCTKEGDIYQARMKDSLVTGLKFTKIRDYELAWVEADILQSAPINKKQEMEDMDAEETEQLSPVRTSIVSDALPILVPPGGQVEDHDTVFVNEPKLSDLKQILLNQGMSAEFVSGVLVIDNCVAIKRAEAGQLLLEGMLSATYYKVRTILYRQFAIL